MKRLVWLVVFALTACSPDVRRFVPPEVDSAHAAHLIAESDPPRDFPRRDEHYLLFETVDGKPIRSKWVPQKWLAEIYVTPGMHTLAVVYVHAGLSASARLQIDAEAGATYFVHRKADAYGVRIWTTQGSPGGPVVGRMLRDSD